MYRVVVETDGKRFPLLNKILRMDTPILQEKAGNSPNYLKFRILPTHPHYGKIDALRSELYVYEDGVELFRGRSVTTQETFNRMHQMTCESDLAYLCDSIIRPYQLEGNIRDFLQFVLNSHNAQVEERKRFRLGRVNVAGEDGYSVRSNDDFSNSLDCLRNKLVAVHGGYLRTRKDGEFRYLDYVTDAGGTNPQAIQYGVNLVDYNRDRDSTTLFTALIPTGEAVEVTNKDGTVGNQAVDITSVNKGIDYIYDQEAVDRYGWIFRHQKFDGVTDPEALLKKAEAYLAQSIYLGDILQLKAVDLANMGVDIDRLQTGYWTKVKSKPHGVDVLYMLEERTRYLQEAGKDIISLGGTVAKLSGSVARNQAQMSAYVQQVAQSTSREINRKVENATQLITGGLGGYIVIGRADNGQPEEVLVMDAPTKENATNVVRLNKNGIGFSNTGYNGLYRNAWTIDGNLVADFITTGTMLADRIRGGTLEVGGTGLGKDGKIVVYDAKGKQVALIDKNGVSASAGTFSGTVQGAKIKAGKNYDVSNESSWMLYADSDSLNIGNNHVVEYGGRYIFETDDEFTGFSPRTNSAGQWALWAAYKSDGDCGFFVRQDGSTFMKRAEVGGDIVLGDLVDEWGDSWGSVSKNIIELWERIESLEGMLE